MSRRWLLATLLIAACGGDGAETPDAGYDCSVETRDDTFVAGLEKAGTAGQLRFRLLESTPAPPGRGNNAWVLEIVDAGGAPVAGATVTVKPFMPDHQHGTGVRARLSDLGAGRYQAEPVNLWMPGLWEITIDARPAAGAADSAVFRFCVAA